MTVSRYLERRITSEQGHACNMCRVTLTEFFHIDHIVRRADGGTDDRENLQALCQECHAKKTLNENLTTPIGSVMLAVRERQKNNMLKRKIDEALERETQQQWGNERIERLYTWMIEKDLVPAAFNRNPVWPLKKQQEFIHLLINNQITSPLYIMKFSNTSKMEIYDGINRLNTIRLFLEGDFFIKIDGEIVYYKLPPNTTGKEFDLQQRKLFLRRDMQVAWWQNLDECEACEMALKLNSGTTANMSERLKWITGTATPRSQILTRISKTDVGIFFLELRDRTVLFSWIGEIVMRFVTDTWRDINVRVTQYTTLEDFFRGENPIDDEERLFNRCITILTKIRTFIEQQYEGQDDGKMFNICQLQLLVRVFHANPDFQVSEDARSVWHNEGKKKRIYSRCQFEEALAAILHVQ